MKRLMVVLAIAAVLMIALPASPVMAQEICYADCDGDRRVNLDDLVIMKTEYFRTDCAPSGSVAELEARVAYLENLLAKVTRVTVDEQDTIRFSGINVQIVNGSGDTCTYVNGRGNLIVGYNEPRLNGTDNRTGSHNIVIGSYHNYSSCGGLVAGHYNTISGEYASISGGQLNKAISWASSVSGGYSNTASANSASVSGGRSNTASDLNASVSGGLQNIASGSYASVSGGDSNIASGDYSSVSGGKYNRSKGAYSFVGGGGGENPGYSNYAVGNYSAILGGSTNTAGDPDHVNTAIGEWSTVSGGSNNTASGPNASVSGGEENVASGFSASVSGGNGRSVTGPDDWLAGACYFCDN